jgi:DNA-binding LacI/PurR family transcriptional regulator
MSRFELARAAVTALRAHVEQPQEARREYNIQTDLIVRESTAPPKRTKQKSERKASITK